MSFRIEEKIVCTKSESFKIFSDLKSTGMNLLYPKRKISSIYFDNRALEMFSDSEEGNLPRKKIRLRSYPPDKDKKNLEVKISSIEGRFKESKRVDTEQYEKYLKYGYFDISYGVCNPVVKIDFCREYFHFKEVRITFDTEIQYQKYTKSNFYIEERCVIEMKAFQKVGYDFLRSIISEPRRRFSKYWNAINFCS